MDKVQLKELFKKDERKMVDFAKDVIKNNCEKENTIQENLNNILYMLFEHDAIFDIYTVAEHVIAELTNELEDFELDIWIKAAEELKFSGTCKRIKKH